MSPAVDSVLCSIVASIIYDIGKVGLGQIKEKNNDFDKVNIENYIFEKLDKKYEILYDSGVLIDFIKNPLIMDTINHYTIYLITGKIERKLIHKDLGKGKHKLLNEEDVIDFLTHNLQIKYQNEDVITIPPYCLVKEFFEEIFLLASEYILERMSKEESAMIYFINRKMNLLGEEIFTRLDEVVTILNKTIQSNVVYLNNNLLESKKYYTKILKDNHKMAHIYLLDKFDINEFYVPPFLMQREDKKHLLRVFRGNPVYRILNEKRSDEEDFDDWKYIFERSNIVYVTGGAGYGKSLFMKKIIEEYEGLNIIDADEYMVIYGELRNFYSNNANNAMPVVDFLQYSMKKETLIEETKISKDLINYYLERGRCIILLDALDEVDKEKRQNLHSTVVNYFRNQNPNNKICITSRARGFLPEKDIEVFEIRPLDRVQIEKYVDNVIKLGKFDKNDRTSFLEQTKVLVEKRFLSSFLVLSLLINIYKAERELPENKLELYQKCFEYISNRREKEKSQKKYDWNLISTLMKDNTFMELANLCLPNNSDVSKELIKEKLTQIYKTKYVSENQTEAAIDQFLIFCSDRTELFVPASGEDCFKFFHRSFFEYFYSQYIFTRIVGVEEIYDAWSKFDVDSEVFELTLAMFKQKNEIKYQEIVEYILGKMNSDLTNKEEKVNSLNIFVLCLQVIDDEVYKRQFVDFLIRESELCKKNISQIHNQRFIVEVINSRDEYVNLISDEYKDKAIYEAIIAFNKIYPDIEEIIKQNKNKNLENEMDFLRIRWGRFYNSNFYSQIFFSKTSIRIVFNGIVSSDIANYGKKAGATAKEINKAQARYKRYKILDSDMKKKIEDIILLA